MGTDKRDLAWLRRHSTADDLLDDGVENFSDLAAPAGEAEPVVPNPEAVATRRRTLAAARTEDECEYAEEYRHARSYSGLALGLLIAMSGFVLLVSPVDMYVTHARMKYLPSVVEHVTPARSLMYGASLLLGGLGLAGFALYRPRRIGNPGDAP